jgi:hypothetical protein
VRKFAVLHVLGRARVVPTRNLIGALEAPAAATADRLPQDTRPENNEKGGRARDGDYQRCEDDGTLDRPPQQPRCQRVEACAGAEPEQSKAKPSPHEKRV